MGVTDQTPRTEAGRRAENAKRTLSDFYYEDALITGRAHHAIDAIDPFAIEAEAAAQARTEALDVDDCDSIILALESIPTWFPGTLSKVKRYRAILAGETE